MNIIKATFNKIFCKDLVTFEEWVNLHQKHGFEYEWWTNSFKPRTRDEVAKNNPEVLDGRFERELNQLYALEGFRE